VINPIVFAISPYVAGLITCVLLEKVKWFSYGATLTVQYAGTYEVLTARELASHCKAIPKASDSTDGQYCIRYIQGFIDGAIVTWFVTMLRIVLLLRMPVSRWV
jgi:Na+/H+ antiporter NhaB